jgi:hypothetical protein
LQKTVELYKRLAINRELYLKHVRKMVKVTEEEERRAFEYSKIRLYVRHFSTEQPDLAEQVSLGIAQFEHTPMYTGGRQSNLTEHGWVDLISWRDVPHESAGILYHLPLKQLSEPYFDGSRYHVFQVVETEREFYSVRMTSWPAARASGDYRET